MQRYFAVSRLRGAALDIFCSKAFADSVSFGAILAVFYKNHILFPRTKRVKTLKSIDSCLPNSIIMEPSVTIAGVKAIFYSPTNRGTFNQI